MKKLLICLMLLFSITVFAEKLTTDGKNNIEKMAGDWDSAFATIHQKKGIWYYRGDEFPDMKIEKYKEGIFKVHVKTTLEKDGIDLNYIFYIAWDTKYKTLVVVDKNGNILKKEQRKVTCLQNSTCN